METKVASKRKKRQRRAPGEIANLAFSSKPKKRRPPALSVANQADAVAPDNTPKCKLITHKSSSQQESMDAAEKKSKRRRKRKKTKFLKNTSEGCRVERTKHEESHEILKHRMHDRSIDFSAKRRQLRDSELHFCHPKTSSLLEKMQARLSGGQFRMLNEILYTCRGEDALNIFKEDPAAFNLYHAGYREQISKWPQSPVGVVIDWLLTKEPSLIVADFGCGDATLAKSVTNKVYSFDLMSSDPLVIACNMAQTPLNPSSIDVAVFCLSLMGTNYPEYLQEAHRVLKHRGWMLVAEVKSRFDVQRGEEYMDKFVKALKEFGFSLMDKDETNKMFIMLYFKKEDAVQSRDIRWPELKPCIYKRR